MGHPDKVADQVSDAILDALLTKDRYSRVACETLLNTGMIVVAGEITSKAKINFEQIIRKTICDIGYDSEEVGMDGNSATLIINLDTQSPDISQGVTAGKGLHRDQGAGDQGLMFGYACKETSVLMPLAIHLSHRLVERLAKVRQNGTLPWLRPDGKSQVTVEYDENNKPVRIDTVVISAQHNPDISHKKICEEITKNVIMPILPKKFVDNKLKIHVNPTGRFVVGGPHGDCGLTGRKIIVDTYGGAGCHGGGAFSGKDPSKVDRSASYMARHIAKNIVAADLADAVEVQLAYAIGVAEPVSVKVDTKRTGKIPEAKLTKIVRKVFPLTPGGIIQHLNLLRPVYFPTSRHGHFGRTGDGFTWEKTDHVKDILRLAK
ncbi:MAG: methionine adenosyltransferase [Sedimentisphaerales bacterium]|nr:methionine adenosyltransferase [Sedimentisphaerales bacterium]